jgi:hypothetical protein
MVSENSLKNLKPYKKGECGNLNGRPLGSRNIKTRIKELLDNYEEIINDNGIEKKIDGNDKLILSLIERAFKDKNLNAINMLLDRLEGKPTQRTEVEIANSPLSNTLETLRDILKDKE